MARVKVPRKSTHIDMTAMCDVAFLLLTFFILTAKPRPQDPIPVDIPSSSVEVAIPDENVLLLTIGDGGKVFYTVDGADVRKQTLLQMGEKYKINFTPEEQNKFMSTTIFGVPIGSLKQFLALDGNDKKNYKQPGIPYDTTANNELSDWIRESRKVNASIKSKALMISIKGDNKEKYPAVQKLIAILQKQKVNKFSLITSLRTAQKTK